MRQNILIILLSAISCTAFAAHSSSSPASQQKQLKQQKQHKHPKKHHQKQHKVTATEVTTPSDPILDAVASQPTTSQTVTTRSIVATPKAKSSIKAPRLYSYAAYALDVNRNEVLVSKNPDTSLPIASITKLMTAMVMLDSGADLDEYITISDDDVDRLRNTFSRLKVGMQLRRRDLLLLALMSSENRAAFAIARTAYPGGIHEFIRRMNAKAKSLGMTHSQFYDPTGLTAQNKSTAVDLAKMVKAAYEYQLIREDTTTKSADVMLSPRYLHRYVNSDALVRADKFQIELSKTGFINEAGHCLVLYALVDNRPIAMVFLNSAGKSGRLVDAMAVKNYIDRMQ
jgi:D-alanyl-D-alanine endopeptidase (penicillin-binding protein 7)